MRNKSILLSFLLLTLFILAACRGEKEETPLPTVAPTAEIPTEIEQGGSSDRPTATPRPITEETAPSKFSAVDPENIDWPPQVIYSSPLPGAEVTLDGAIAVRFDQPMDQESVEAAFAVGQANTDNQVSGDFDWLGEDTVVFTPKTNLQGKQTYQVTIDKSAKGVNGQEMVETVVFPVQAEGALAVSQVIPEDGTGGVDTDAAITVLFNRPVVPLVSSGDQSGLPQPLTFNPPVTGTGDWTSTSIYRFVPDEPLAGATTYQVTVDADLEDVTGSQLGSTTSWQFTTLSPEVVMAEPSSEEPIDLVETFAVTFNMPMDPASTEAAISLRGVNVPAVALAYEWSEDGRIVEITPANELQLQTTYQLRVDPSARSATGEATLGQEVIYSYNTWPFPGIQEVQPARNSVAEVWQRGVYIQFVSPMNWDTVEDRILIDPEPGFVRYYFNDYNNSVSLDFSLELDAEYTVTVPGDVTDVYGNAMGSSFTWQFQAAGRPPLASFNLPPQVSQLTTSVETAVDIIHANVGEVTVELFDMGLPLNLINRPYDIVDYRPNATPVGQWQVPFETARNEVGVYNLPLANGGVLPTGVYLLKMNSAELDQDNRYWQNQNNLLVVGDTNIVIKEMFGDVHVWVTDLASGEPVAGRNLTLFNSQGVEIGTAVSDADGFANFPYQPIESYLDGVTVVSNLPGEAGFGVANSRWNQNIGPWQFGFEGTTSDEAPTFAYIYTDRPIYRPGDTVHYKGIVRAADYGRYGLPEPQSLTLRLIFSNFFGGVDNAVDETFTVDVGADGTFTGEYVLPEDAATGTYQIFSEDQFVQASINFSVAEYRAPEFLLTMTAEQDEAVRGTPVDVLVEASYFFGGSATDLQVEWNVYEQPYFLNVPGYSFTDSGDYYYTDTSQFGGGFGNNFVTNGSGMTDENGRFTISLPTDLLDDAAAGSRDVLVEATVLDVSGFPVAARTNVVFHAADLYVGTSPEDYVSDANTDTAVNLITVDWDGEPVPNQPVEVVFYEREWIPIRTDDGGGYYTAWETEDTEVARTRATTNGDGEAQASFVPEHGGNYLAVAQVGDGAGRTHLSSVSLYVTDSGQVGWQTDPVMRTMDLVANQDEYRSGDVAQILVQSPFAEPVQAWLTIERGHLIEQRVVTLNSSSEVLDIPIESFYAPNVHVTVTAVKGVSPNDEANIFADIRVGMVELVVSPEELELDIVLTPQEESLGPGDTAVYDIFVTDQAGNPVQADLSLALVDLAVLTLKDDNAVQIVDAFYFRQPMRSQMGSGLFVSGEGLPVEIPNAVGGRGGGGGDFAAESAVALEGEEDDVRRDFPDTAFWEPHVVTDENGRATIEVPLPDTLTTWRMSSKGATPDTLVGQSQIDIVTSLPLLLRPVTPRFFTVGDVAKIGAVVHNNTDAELETAVSLQATGLTLNDPAEQTVTIAAGDSELVRWEVAVDNVDFADLTFRVEGGDFSDATKPSFGVGDDNLIPVYQFTGQDVVGTSGELGEAGRRVEAILLPPGVDPEQGAVDVTFSASLAAAVLDSLQVQNNFEISDACASSVAYQLLPNAATAKLVNDLNLGTLRQALQPELDDVIDASITRLSGLVKSDGGWGWCYSSESDVWISAYVLQSLLMAQSAGYAVDGNVINGAVQYLQSNLTNAVQLQPEDVNLQAYLLYVLAEAGTDVTAQLDALFAEQRALLLPSAQAMMVLAYERNGATGNNSDALLSDLNNGAVVSATGAHWETDIPTVYGGLSHDIYETAVVINTLAQMEPNNPNLPPAVRWLMNARTAVVWPSMHDTSWSITALNEWMAATGELNADYRFDLLVNLQAAATGFFTQASLGDSETVAVELDSLQLDEVNYFQVERGDGDGILYYTMHLNSAIDANQIEAINRGFSVERVYYDAACDPELEECAPITEIAAGQQVRVVLSIIVPNDRVNVIVEDPIPSGATAVDPGLNTTSSFDEGSIMPVGAEDMVGYWGWWYFDRIEYRDEKVRFLSQFLPAGTYQYTYFMDTNIPGEYQVMPTFAFEDFTPEVNGRSDGMIFTIVE